MSNRSMSFLRIPQEFFKFVKNNPKLAEFVALGVLTMKEAQEEIIDIENSLKKTNIVSKLLDNGTEEELERFIEAVLKGVKEGVKTFDDISDESIEEIKKELGSAAIHTEINIPEEKYNNLFSTN